MPDAAFLIGGSESSTTEWIPTGGAAQQQGFIVRHGIEHCSIQISVDVAVVTGGSGTEDLVTEYQLTSGTETPHTSMGHPRYQHACGSYLDADGQQVSKKFCSMFQI